MAETNLAFAKIVATPTPTAWSQAYSAGRLFAALSLQTEIVPEEGQEHLNSIGKDLISTLESEFFTLENKDLDSIKKVIATTIAGIKENIKSSIVVCFLADNVLYLFATGGGKAILKRAEKIGTVLEGEDGSNIKSASGYVQEGDIIILQTKPFLRVISPSVLASSMDNNNPDDIAEELAPHVHEKAEGGAAAVILVYKQIELETVAAVTRESEEDTGDKPSQAESFEESETNEEEMISVEDLDEKPETEDQIPPLSSQMQQASNTQEQDTSFVEEIKPPSPSPFLTDQFPKRSRLSLGKRTAFLGKLSRQRRIILTIVIVLTSVIVITSILALTNRGGSQNQELFASAIQDAQAKYDEGQSLKDLNADLSQQSFKDARRILEENKPKFKEGSDEEKQISELLTKVNSEISSKVSGDSVTPTEVKASESQILSYELNNSSANYFVQNEDNAYFLDGTGVSQIDKGNDKKTQIIKKGWKTDGGIGLFGANIYVLDRADGVFKFVPSGTTYTKGDYFSDETPSITQSSAMAIDGSVFILFKDGHIEKYTKAKKDTFGLSGMDKQLSAPSKIFTDANTDNLYVLDNGNSRIVVLDKTGKFVSSYSAGILKNAKDFEVKEKDKKIFILSSGKIYQIAIK